MPTDPIPLTEIQMKLFLVAALALCAPATSQLASYRITGTGCTTGRLTLTIGPVPLSVQGVPRLGSSFTLVTEGTADYPWGRWRQVYLITGVSNTSSGGIRLPFDISTLFPGQPYCGLLRTSPEVVFYVPRVRDYRTPVRITFQVPNVPALAGWRFFQQVMSIERSAFGPPFRALALSAGGEGTIGF